MFQDSVPAGSYNDPFLSSVCMCVKHLHRCKTSSFVWGFSFRLCIPGQINILFLGEYRRGTGADLPIQSNEAMAFRWMSGLINHLYLLFPT